ncbi:MAG TPA: hypothetical protein DEB39_13495 [Planctomycetaceae bacterium]|nr:hypothetical protein [Planctomycetaceae bacterium]
MIDHVFADFPPDETPAYGVRPAKSRNSLTLLAGFFATALLLGFGIVFLMTMAERPGRKAVPFTPEELAALDDHYAFRILASRDYPEDASVIEEAEKLPADQNRVVDDSGKAIAVWVDVDPIERKTTFSAPGAVDDTVRRIVPPRPGTMDSNSPPDRLQILLLIGENDLAGRDLVVGAQFEASIRPHNIRPVDIMAITFRLTPTAGATFSRLTGGNLSDPHSPLIRRLGIVLDGELQSAPAVMSTISTEGVIAFSRPTNTAEQEEMHEKIQRIVSRFRKHNERARP